MNLHASVLLELMDDRQDLLYIPVSDGACSSIFLLNRAVSNT